MFTFRQKLLFTLIASTLSTSVLSAPQLFSVAAKDPNGPDTPLLRSLQNNHRDYQLVNINQNILLSRSSSFGFKARDNGQEIEIKAISLEKDNVGNDIWRGKAENGQGEATFSVRDGKINGGITLNDGSYYEIYPVTEGLQALVKVDASDFHEDENDTVTDEKAEAHQHELSDAQSERETLSTDTTPARIRVLYLYTNQSRGDFGGNPILFAGYLNDKLNQSYADSETHIQFDVAGVIDSKIDETAITTMINQMITAGTPLGKLVAEKKAETHADLITLIVKDGSTNCGMAHLGLRTSVVAVGCSVATGWHTLAHEIGHNFGLGHNVGSNSKGPYAHGHRVEGKFRTIMSSVCSLACTRINHFSTPLKNQDGLPMGTAAQNDAVRFLREVRFNFSDTYPYWDSQYQLNDGDLPAHQYFEVILTNRQTSKTISLDKKIINPGQWDWPFEVATAVNSYFPKGIVEAGRPRGGVIIPASGSSYLNHIWLHQDKKDAYKVDVKRKTYAVVRGKEWGDVMPIDGGNGMPADATMMLNIKDKVSGQVLETHYFINGRQALDKTSWPHRLAQIINSQQSTNVIAGELKDGNFNTVTGSGFRNLLWFPLEKKNTLSAEFTLLSAAENPWVEEVGAYGNKHMTDLEKDTVVTIKVKNSSGVVVEQHSVRIDDAELDRYRWPTYAAKIFNQEFTQIIIGEKDKAGSGSIDIIPGSQYRNLIWKKQRANMTVEVSYSK
ncbi:putative carbohydrate-binding protein with CBM5 and CBM33 domain [Pantoea cypripedii]|nr:putative carbohydrate-binding protein with CBM5 and CBM33 domain [Pantoea cypripedii]